MYETSYVLGLSRDLKGQKIIRLLERDGLFYMICD